MRRQRVHVLAIMLAGGLSASCGLTVPDIKEAWDVDKPPDAQPPTQAKVPGAAQIEFEIKKHVYCQLKDAVQQVNKINLLGGPPGKLRVVQHGLIPMDWGAQVSLSLQVDETSGLSPGVTLNQVIPNATNVFGPGNTVTTAQSFGLGFGGTFSSTATRIDKFDPFWSIAFLMIPDSPASICRPGKDPLMDLGWTAATSSPLILEGDLGIKDWLLGAMEVSTALASVGSPPAPLPGGGGGAGAGSSGGGSGSGSSGGGSGSGGATGNPGKDAVSYEIKFVIVSSANVTPTWKLVRVSANTGSSPFFNTGRTRTHDLIITIGPQNTQTNNSHLALQVGNAVGNANRAAPPAQ
ncbi:hypothetical protein [Bradyrhizobium sp.]|jgi:hypothetical protein|uniref:hypothetical protein n=1 Tax=Bradyrhizobium sp. TaxID=376 RepID=UPI003D129DF1